MIDLNIIIKKSKRIITQGSMNFSKYVPRKKIFAKDLLKLDPSSTIPLTSTLESRMKNWSAQTKDVFQALKEKSLQNLLIDQRSIQTLEEQLLRMEAFHNDPEYSLFSTNQNYKDVDRSDLSNLSQGNKDLQEHLDNTYKLEAFKLKLKNDGINYSIFDRLFRRGNTDSQEMKKAGSWSDLEEDADLDFDSWQGVSREGQRDSSEGESDLDDNNDGDDGDDGPQGGEMMPIPDMF